MDDLLEHQTLPNPLQLLTIGDDDLFGHTTAVSSIGDLMRYQLTVRFDGGKLVHDRERTLVVLGLSPEAYPEDPDDQSPARIDSWLPPYLRAAAETEFNQVIVVCLYAIRNPELISHDLHGGLNGYFTAGPYLAAHAMHIAIAAPAGHRCQTCVARGLRDTIEELEDEDVSLWRLVPDGGNAKDGVWLPYRQPTLRIVSGKAS